jgi:hypothetical protein
MNGCLHNNRGCGPLMAHRNAKIAHVHNANTGTENFSAAEPALKYL